MSNLHTKDSHSPLALLMLGPVVGVQHGGDFLLLYYEDGHKVRIEVTDDMGLAVSDWGPFPTC